MSGHRQMFLLRGGTLRRGAAGVLSRPECFCPDRRGIGCAGSTMTSQRPWLSRFHNRGYGPDFRLSAFALPQAICVTEVGRRRCFGGAGVLETSAQFDETHLTTASRPTTGVMPCRCNRAAGASTSGNTFAAPSELKRSFRWRSPSASAFVAAALSSFPAYRSDTVVRVNPGANVTGPGASTPMSMSTRHPFASRRQTDR